jgi:hypothetical protein
MTRNIETEGKLEDFINKLASLGYSVTEVRKKPQIYSIDGKRVNIRCRGKSREIAGGRGFWYSISFNVLQEVDWVVYLTTTSDYFFMFPVVFLDGIKDRMYPDRKKVDTGVFDVDWDNEMIILRHGNVERISKYYHNLIHPDNYPRF